MQVLSRIIIVYYDFILIILNWNINVSYSKMCLEQTLQIHELLKQRYRPYSFLESDAGITSQVTNWIFETRALLFERYSNNSNILEQEDRLSIFYWNRIILFYLIGYDGCSVLCEGIYITVRNDYTYNSCVGYNINFNITGML